MSNRKGTETQSFLRMDFKKLKPCVFGLILICSLCLCASEVHSQEVLETPGVLLNAKYLEDVRAPLKVGEAAPDFVLNRCEFDRKEKLQLSKWRDPKNSNGSVIVFWAFWCDTWKDITRDLNLIKSELNGMKLQLLAVSVDASQQPVARRSFETKKIWWPVVIDEKSTQSATWGVRRVPTIFILDKNGAIAKVYEGFPGKQTFVKEIAKALQIKVPVVRSKKK